MSRDVAGVGAFLLFIFLCTVFAHFMFVKEMAYDMALERKNAEAASSFKPGQNRQDDSVHED